jgi:acyl-CoA thioesterase II
MMRRDNGEVAIRCEPPVSVQRRVHLSQHGAPICDAVFRFDPPSGDLTYQRVSLAADVRAPESLPTEAEMGAREGWAPYAVGPIESRRITSPTQVKDDEPAVWTGWLAPRKPLPQDQTIQTAALVFLSEYRSHWAVERVLGPAFRTTDLALDNLALWIHRPIEWNDFWFVTTRSDVGSGGRCLSRREIFTRQGVLVASAAWQLSASRRG